MGDQTCSVARARPSISGVVPGLPPKPLKVHLTTVQKNRKVFVTTPGTEESSTNKWAQRIRRRMKLRVVVSKYSTDPL